ncbi:MAG: PepSY domain-containing protein [Acidimicrobiia bacterium]
MEFVGAGAGDGRTPTASTAEDAAADKASRRWRSVWRLHFYSGIFAAPILVMFALTGLVILYTQPIHDFLQGDLRTVSAQGAPRSYAAQERAVERAYPDNTIASMTVPTNDTHSTEFDLDDGRAVFVDPYTGKVLGTTDPSGGIVGLANRLHGLFNNESTMRLPAMAALFDGGPVMREYIIGDMVLEIFTCWAILLVVSGLYLWWPRRSRAQGGRVKHGVFKPRVGAKGRAKWRDLHAIPGMFAAVGTLFVLVTGLFWSSYWADTYTAVANRITPTHAVEQPNSALATLGDVDRFDHNINWNAAGTTIPASKGTGIDPTDLPARASIDTIVRAAKAEGMLPGYTIAYPIDSTDDAGNPVFGSFALVNSWPRKTSEAKSVYVDQFTAERLAVDKQYGLGGVSVASDTLVSVHMGTEFGVVNRILMTLLCVAVLWSVISAVIMYTKRRRSGLGFPRRPVDVKVANGMLVIAVVLALVYPLWGVTALIVLLLDRFVVRKVGPLRRTFGQK